MTDSLSRETRPIFVCGFVLLATLIATSILDAQVQSTAFLWLVTIASLAYVAMLVLVSRGAVGSRRALVGCLLLAVVWTWLLAGTLDFVPVSLILR